MIIRIEKKRVITMIVIAFVLLVLTAILNGYLTGIKICSIYKYAVMTDNGYDNYISQYISKETFDLLNCETNFRKHGPLKKYLQLSMRFSVNDFFKNGIVWMKYTLEVKDENNLILTGATGVPVVLILKKDRSNWRVNKIFESP